MMYKFMMFTCLLFVAGCQQGPSDEQLAREKAAQMKHHSENMLWRKDRIDRLTQPDGWLPKNGITRVGAGEANGTRIGVGPSKIGMISVTAGNEVWLQPEAGVALTIDGQPVAGKTRLIADSQGRPTVVGFDNGNASFIVIERGGRMALRVRDANAPTRTGFTGIDYFPLNRAFQFEANFVPHEAGRTIEIVNILGMVEPMMNPGTVTFMHEGKPVTLEAIDEGDHRLFLVFADRTSGKETYAAARFLYAAYPGPDGKTIVDFNEAYNPPCAFTPYSTCPMPPPGNRMDFAVNAGEKKPRKL